MDQHQEHIDPRKEIEELAPSLAKLKKRNAFKVPSGYFEELPFEVQNRVLESEKSPFMETLLNLFTFKRIAYGAVGVAILLVGIPMLLDKSQAEINLNAQELLEMVDDGSLEFDEETILDVYAVSLDNDISMDDLLDEDQIINYLIDEDIDIDDDLIDL